MNIATLRLALVAAFVLAGTSSVFAQGNVTFQVDMNAAIDNCAITPESVISVPGSFNDWTPGASVLTDSNGDGIYTGTFEIADGSIDYKFHGTPEDRIGWENDPNRNATVSGDIVLPVVAFNKTLNNYCVSENYEIIFEVDMSIQVLAGAFDPATDRVWVAGELFNWGPGPADTELFLDPFNEDPYIYVGAITREVAVPSANPYKYIMEDANGQVGWEGGPDYIFHVTGDEPDNQVVIPRRYFDNVGPDDIITEEQEVRIVVDLRPAYYFLMDNGVLPVDTQTGEQPESIDGLFVNGPIGHRALEVVGAEWATWGPDGLGQIESRRFFDDGTHGDVVAGDTLYTRTYTYPVGTSRTLIGKFGINGYDNEAGFGADHHMVIEQGATQINFVFGCVRRADGTYTATNGPIFGEEGGSGDFSDAYAEYVLIDNNAAVPTCTVVRGGGGVNVEPTGATPDRIALNGNYPNPVTGVTTFEYSLPQASSVSLEVFDVMGRRVAVVVDDVQQANTYRVSFDASGLASGTYIYRLVAGDQVLTQRMSVVR